MSNIPPPVNRATIMKEAAQRKHEAYIKKCMASINPRSVPILADLPVKKPTSLQWALEQSTVHETWGDEDYEREGVRQERMTLEIRMELNDFKKEEMQVHEESHQYTHYHSLPKHLQQPKVTQDKDAITVNEIKCQEEESKQPVIKKPIKGILKTSKPIGDVSNIPAPIDKAAFLMEEARKRRDDRMNGTKPAEEPARPKIGRVRWAAHEATVYEINEEHLDSDRKNLSLKMTPQMMILIHMELNKFKKEMEVHDESRQNTHLHALPRKFQQRA